MLNDYHVVSDVVVSADLAISVVARIIALGPDGGIIGCTIRAHVCFTLASRMTSIVA